MKVAIVTITEGTNYGNRLQNYALQRILENMGITVETLRNKCGNEKKIKRILIKLYVKILELKYRKIIKNREKVFKEFNRRYIKFSNIEINNKYKNPEINNKFDYFICGSDQIWNPNFKENANANFLQFADKEKRIAFCPSFGVSTISEERKNEYKKYIEEIPSLSVREDAGADIIKKLTNRTAEVLLDPTLLIDKNDWEKIMREPKNKPNKKYILTYFLGSTSDRTNIELNQLANKYDLEIINLSQKYDKKYYTVGPCEFLWYIKNSKLFFTDSFHGCIFSTILDKTFYVLERDDKNQSMNSRIETLLNKLNLEERKFKNWDDIRMEHDYSNAYSILQDERKKSMDFLKKALKLNDSVKGN